MLLQVQLEACASHYVQQCLFQDRPALNSLHTVTLNHMDQNVIHLLGRGSNTRYKSQTALGLWVWYKGSGAYLANGVSGEWPLHALGDAPGDLPSESISVSLACVQKVPWVRQMLPQDSTESCIASLNHGTEWT